MQRAAKQANITYLNMVLNGGLNYSQSPANIAENELKRALNFIYDPSTDTLMTRPGTVCQTAATIDGTNPILRIYYYEKTTTTAYLVAAANGNLYYLSGASLNAWTLIGALTDTTTVPSFLTFNSKLLIADGGTHIRTWDGTTYTTLGTSPQATALSMIKNRVVCNTTAELDSVYLSKTNDETHWDTAVSAIGLKAGYGDTFAVNAFTVFGDDLIVSKKGNRGKRLYRVNTADATATNWYVKLLSENNAAQNAQTMISAWNNVFFVDTNGFKSIKGVTEYGDLQVDSTGQRINPIFAESYTCDNVVYLPLYNAILFNINDRVFSYTERYDPVLQARIPAFTDLFFAWNRCRSICQAGDTIYLAGHNGYLYKLDETKSTDETSPGVTATYTANIRTKTFTFFVDGILRRSAWYLRPKLAGAGTLYVCTAENVKVALKTINPVAEAEFLADATEELNVATDELYDTGTSAWVESSRNRVRGQEMAFELELTSGRCGAEWCKAEVAVVEGGE